MMSSHKQRSSNYLQIKSVLSKILQWNSRQKSITSKHQRKRWATVSTCLGMLLPPCDSREVLRSATKQFSCGNGNFLAIFGSFSGQVVRKIEFFLEHHCWTPKVIILWWFGSLQPRIIDFEFLFFDPWKYHFKTLSWKLYCGRSLERVASSLVTANNSLNKVGYVSWLCQYKTTDHLLWMRHWNIDQSAAFEYSVSLQQAQTWFNKS